MTTETKEQPKLTKSVSAYMRALARKSHAARKGTEKAIAHARAMSAKSVEARRRKAAERRAAEEAGKN